LISTASVKQLPPAFVPCVDLLDFLMQPAQS
jgi:hypothetical protein